MKTTSSLLLAAGLLAQTGTVLHAQLSPRGENSAKLKPETRRAAIGAIDQGLRFLTSAQKREGYWSSTDYPGLSALVLQAYLLAPSDAKARSKTPVRRGLEYLRSQAQPDGGIYSKGMSNYNTSIALATLLHAGDPGDRELIEKAKDYIAGAQKDGADVAESKGGFGYEPEGRGSRPDLDNTVFAIEAMALYQQKMSRGEVEVESGLDWEAAAEFVSRCQNLKSTNKADWVDESAENKGGFTYTPQGAGDGKTHSYGTMTYSALLSLVHADVDAEDERVEAALEWLGRHYTLDENPGQGEEGLYYYYFVMAKALAAAGLDTLPTKGGKQIDWRTELTGKLLALRKDDGSWANSNGRWMEKDPVLVTSYVVLALNTICRGS